MYINFKVFEEYLLELKHAWTDKRADRQTNRIHKHFSTSLKNVKSNRWCILLSPQVGNTYLTFFIKLNVAYLENEEMQILMDSG